LIVGNLPSAELRRRLTAPGLRIRIGPVVAQIQSSSEVVRSCIALHYAAHELAAADEFADFRVSLQESRGLARLFRPPKAIFGFDGTPPFQPLPAHQGFALLEWGLNWAIAAYCHQYLIVHAAIVERDDRALLLPAPPGSGKSIIALQFICEAIRHGGKAALFVFDEEIGLLFDRAKPLGFDLAALRDAGHLHIQQLDAAELSPGEFAHRVRATIQDPTVKTVVIDSLNGYQAAMPQENSLILHMHEILQFLNRHGVSTFLTVAQQGMMGDMRSPVDITYLADSVIMLRFFEARGSVKRAISVVEERTGRHEATIREFWIDGGLHVGEPLTNFQGVLRGVPLILGENPSAAAAALQE